MRKRIIALFLALVMALGLVMPASAMGIDPVGGDGAPAASTPAPAIPDTPAPAIPDTPAPASLGTPAPAALTTPSVVDPPETEVTGVRYLDGDTTRNCANGTSVTETTTLQGGATADAAKWYYVNSAVTISNTVTITGHVNLILCNGKTLTVNVSNDGTYSDDNVAITISSGASLTIYQQPEEEGTTPGALTVNGSNVGKAIDIQNGGSMTVNGGAITVNLQGNSIAGIRVAGTMTVNSGTVQVPYNYSNGGISVTGGTLTINGGTVNAEDMTHGILIGDSSSTGTLNFNGGTLSGECKGPNPTNGIVVKDNGSTFNLPADFWWRTTENGSYSRNKVTPYTSDGAYQELTTTKPDGYTVNAVTYMDWVNGALAEKTYEDPIKVTNQTAWGTASTDTWYYVEGAVTISGTVGITGDVHLILGNGATLTASGGIKVGWGDASDSGSDNTGASLTIYQQPEVTDKTIGNLVADGGSSMSCGIQIFKSSLTVNGGEVTANGGTSSGESNGIYILSKDSSMTVNSGKVTATGKNLAGNSCGIRLHNGTPTLTINGGEVTATGGVVNDNAEERYNSIGIYNCSNGTVTINGGKVTATGGEVTNGNSYGIRNEGTVNITDGTVIARRANTGRDQSRAVYLSNVTTTPLNLPLTYWWRTAGTGTGDAVKYKTQEWAYKANDLAGTYFEVTTQPQSDVVSNPRVDYLDWDGSKLVTKTGDNGIADYTVVSASNSGDVTLTGGTSASSPKWYAVKRDVTITGKLIIDGHVNLLLCNGAKLTVQKGIVEGGNANNNGNSLTIYGQPEEAGKAPGKLEATGVAVMSGDDYDYSAGIDISTLTINGGEVTATGGTVAKYGGNSYGVEVKALTINSGLLTAKGGDATNRGYSSIGANTTETLTVNGGELKATGGVAETSIGIGSLEMTQGVTINGGKVTGTGGNDAEMSVGILAGILSVNEPQPIPERGIRSPEGESSTVVAVAPEVTGIGGNTTGGASMGIFAASMAVDGVNALGNISMAGIDLPGDNTDTDSTSGTTCSAKITAKGGTVSVAEDEVDASEGGMLDGVSCGMFVMLLHVGLSDDDIADIMNSIYGPDPGMLGEGVEEEPDGDEETPTTGSTAQINAAGNDIGMMVFDLFGMVDTPMPAVWLNGGTLTATGAATGIDVLGMDDFTGYDIFGLDILGLDTFGIDTYGNEEENGDVPTRPAVYVQKGTLIADATGTGGKGLDLGDPVNDTVPLKCPAEYWWRISKTMAYTKYPGMTAYSYTGAHDYVEITSNGAGLPLVTEPEEETPLPGPEGSKHQPIRRQKNAVAALIPTKPEKVDVASPETFDAGIALYVGLGVLSLTGSAAWVGKRKKW